MQNIEELVRRYGSELSSLLPLLLLFAFWWIFSMLGSRLKKTGEKSEQAESPGMQDRILEMMTGSKDEDDDARPQRPKRPSFDAPGTEVPVEYYQNPNGPVGDFQPKPINPRWWGA